MRHRISYVLAIVGCCLLIIGCTPSAKSSRPSLPQTQIIGTPCPQSTPVAVPNLEPLPQLLVILIDRSGSYATQKKIAIDQLRRILPDVIKIGDELRISWIGSKSGDPAETFFNQQFNITHTLILEPTPTFRAATTDIKAVEEMNQNSTPAEESSMQREQRIATMTAIAQQAKLTATEKAYLLQKAEQQYSCDVNVVVLRNNTKIISQSIEQEHERNTFIREMQDSFDEAEKLPSTDQHSRISDALVAQSMVLHYAVTSGHYRAVRLIIFSDMQDTENLSSTDLSKINLIGVDVNIVRFYCKKPKDCNQTENFWKDVLAQHTRSSKFIPVDATSDSYLKDLMR